MTKKFSFSIQFSLVKFSSVRVNVQRRCNLSYSSPNAVFFKNWIQTSLKFGLKPMEAATEAKTEMKRLTNKHCLVLRLVWCEPCVVVTFTSAAINSCLMSCNVGGGADGSREWPHPHSDTDNVHWRPCTCRVRRPWHGRCLGQSQRASSQPSWFPRQLLATKDLPYLPAWPLWYLVCVDQWWCRTFNPETFPLIMTT